MEPRSNHPPLVVIVGQTASGKSSVALELAARYDGEIICADSRTVYKGMDIGTAKPSAGEQGRIRHHLLDVTTPDHLFTAADFKHQVDIAIQDIARRGKLPIMVGGTGLYVDAVIFNFGFRPPVRSQAQRTSLEGLSVEELHMVLQKKGLPLPANERNPRHLMRQIETGGVQAMREPLRDNTLVLGITREKEDLHQRIQVRIDDMLKYGLEAEVRKLVEIYGWTPRAFQTIGYQEFRRYFEGLCDLDEVKAAVVRSTEQYAKRQLTWFKRNKSIHWICKAEESVDLITTLLNK